MLKPYLEVFNMSIATEITRIQTAKVDLKTSINAKLDGVAIDDELIDEYADFVDQISTGSTLTGDAAVTDVLAGKTFYNTDPNTKLTGTLVAGSDGWTRPSEWLTQPTYTAGQQQIDLLFAVGENAINDIAFNITTSTGTYSVDWGDGNSSTGVTSGVNAEHIFDWSNVSSSTLMSNGMRQAMITITADAGNITAVDFREKHSLNTKAISNVISQIIEINIVGENISAITLGAFPDTLNYNFLENFYFPFSNSITTFGQAFNYLPMLKSVQEFDSSGISYFTNMFYSCTSLVSIPLLDMSNAINCVNMFKNCSSLPKIPLLDMSGCFQVNSCFENCTSLKELPQLNLSSSNNSNAFILNCPLLKGSFNLNTTLNENFSDMFEQCDSLTEIVIDLTSGVTFGDDMLEFNYNLAKLTITNMPIGFTGIDLAQTNLDADALVQVFNDLYDRSATTAGTIKITSAYGASALSTVQREIATNKNWNITG